MHVGVLLVLLELFHAPWVLSRCLLIETCLWVMLSSVASQ
jgi:hypothetical protein